MKDVSKDLRPISLTPVFSKIAEEFVVEEQIRPAMFKKIVDSQFRSISKSSTTHALLSMVHSWTKHTDGTGYIVRVVLFDYREALGLINRSHNSCWKIMALDIPHGILCWSNAFLKDHKQRVKLA